MKPSAKTAAKLFSTAFGLLALTGFSVTPASLTTADLILKNGRVYTDPLAGPTEGQSPGPVWSQAISIRGSDILSIGTDRAIEKEKGPGTQVIDLKGRVVLPGFNDAHVHLMNGGLALTRIDLTGVPSIFELQEKVKSFAAANTAKRWILGQGWDHTVFPVKKYPTKEDLDSVVSDRPVMLWHSDHHLVLLNSKGLELLRISTSTASPKNGEIQKNEKGEPTGLLFEEAAFEAEHKVDNPSSEELRQAFVAAQNMASKFGVTSIQGGPIRGEDEVKVIEEMYNERKLHLRYAMWGNIEKPQEFLALKEKYKHLPEEWVNFSAVKGFVDGVISSRTAALTENYSDDPPNKGEPMYTQERLNELVLNANRLGLPVALHAIGDRAVTMAVNAITAAKRQLFNSRLRNRIEHIEVAPPFVYTKFADFHIVASVQPSHMVYDNESQNYNETRLGPVRIKNDFAWKNFLVSNAHLAFGTDWPVETLNPMVGLFAAVFRQNLNGRPVAGLQPAQKLTMSQAVDAYTLGSAYATREDHVKGSLREGKYADVVVLDKDPFKAKDLDVLKIPVYLTISGGKVVYDGSTPELKAGK
ncbi:MAG: amidohydrolase [Deltaproteobacteria bacterium]|nr:amidohydrolase [Deltaproteobacteria bacterium]